jgi:hypothetical protein
MLKGKGKGEVVPVLNSAPRHKDVLESEVQLHAFLTWALDGGEWSPYPQEKSPRYPLDRRLSGPQSRYDHGRK